MPADLEGLQISTISKSSLPAPQSGQTQDSGTSGEMIGAGMPGGAFGGKAEYMKVAPDGPVYQAVGGMLGFLFTDAERVTNFNQAAACGLERFKSFVTGMLAEGIYLAPSTFEAGFVSSAHSPAAVIETLAAAEKVLAGIAG